MNVTNLTLFESVRRENGRRADGWVYIVGAPEVPKVKIGYSGNVPQRLRDMSANSPLELRVLAQRRGTIKDERLLHSKLKAYRAHGEWFRLEGDVLALLNELMLWRETATGQRAKRQQMWPDGTSRRLTETMLSRGPRAAGKMKRYFAPRPEGEPLELVAHVLRPLAIRIGVHDSWITS